MEIKSVNPFLKFQDQLASKSAEKKKNQDPYDIDVKINNVPGVIELTPSRGCGATNTCPSGCGTCATQCSCSCGTC
jgi:hypothetical protein